MSARISHLVLLAFTIPAFAACQATPRQPAPFRGAHGRFPAANRPVSHIVSSCWSTEEARDRVNEAGQVMDKSGLAPGMTAADIGAGDGYYTVRLARRVGKQGRVLAEDIDSRVTEALAKRVARERLDNVSVRLGEPANPKLPTDKIDRIFMIHMYHEIERPYELLWRIRPSLRPTGEIVVVDANRPTRDHGTPPALLQCELARVGYMQVTMEDIPAAGAYVAIFRAPGPRPDPAAIRSCSDLCPIHTRKSG